MQIVHVLYQENDWVYVISEENNEGFIPHSYCAPYGSQRAGLALNVKKKLPRDLANTSGTSGPGPGGLHHSSSGPIPTTELQQQKQHSYHDGAKSDHNVTISTSIASASAGLGMNAKKHCMSER